MLAAHLRFFDAELPYEVVWHEVQTTKHALFFENRTVEVWSIPLRHRVPCAGFLFREKEPPVECRQVQDREIRALDRADHRGETRRGCRAESGEVIPNGKLTYRPYRGRSDAYLSI